MKISITDQFLWDMFNFLSEAEDQLRFIFHPPRRWKDVFLDADNPIYQKYYKILKADRFAKLIYYLKRNNYIKAKSLDGKKAIFISKKGLKKVSHFYFKCDRENRLKRKDGKWIMVIFDIPKNHKKNRDLLRSVLKNLGYKVFQYSVWITPYDVFEKTQKLLQFYSIDHYVRIFLIEELDK
ncbi:MAG: hypothetical protein AAB340_00825 [Patescibacteria group bacterium]